MQEAVGRLDDILMLALQTHIISCSLDGTIKVWNAIEPASPGAVLDVNAAYVFPPEEPGKPVRTLLLGCAALHATYLLLSSLQAAHRQQSPIIESAATPILRCLLTTTI